MERASIVLPIRFATAQTAVQTTTREVSMDGVYVRCLEPPAKGTSVALKLYLPGGREPLQAQATVREVTAAGESGFWAEFDALGEPQAAQLAELLERKRRAADAKPIGAISLQPADDPRRSTQRVNARFAVRFATVQDFVLEYAANISAGGVFVQCDDPPALKTVVKIELQLPGGAEPVPAQGLVVHRVTPEQARERGTIAGMGVQFVQADDTFRQRIDAAIDEILKSGA